jgi:hypothetical protein
VPKPPEVRARDEVQQGVYSQEMSVVDTMIIPGLPIAEPPPEEIEIPSEDMPQEVGPPPEEIETPSEDVPQEEVEVLPTVETEEISAEVAEETTEQPKELKEPIEEIEETPEAKAPDIDQEMEELRSEVMGLGGLSDSDKQIILEELETLPPDERRKTLDLIKKELMK